MQYKSTMRIHSVVRGLMVVSAMLSAAFLLVGVGAVAQQQSSCDAVLPATIMSSDGKMIQGLDAGSLRARLNHKPMGIVATSPDMGPRRILLLVDTSRKLNDEAWKIIVGVSKTTLSNARPQDDFALMSFGGTTENVPFGKGRETILQKLDGWMTGRPKEDGAKSANMYNALDTGLELFGPPQFGDAVFLFAAGPGSENRSVPNRVAKALFARATRVFVVVLTQRSLSGFWMRDPGRPSASIPLDADTGGLRDLALNTGGMILAENTDPPWEHYQLTHSRLEQLRSHIWGFYAAVVRVYRIELKVPATGKLETWKLELAESGQKQFPQSKVLYPQEIACTGVTQ